LILFLLILIIAISEIKGGIFMLFEPPIDEIAKKVGNVYTATIIIGARAKELESKIPTLLQGSSNIAIEYAAKEVHDGKVVAVQPK
jgi:DNA-directed RNA polymerase subunit K/omega